MKLTKNKLILFIPTLTLLALLAVFVFQSLPDTKTSVVVGTYSNSAMDGCDGYRLENGDTVDTFCFWTKPENQTDYEGPIKVGDSVDYGTNSGRQFIRLKK